MSGQFPDHVVLVIPPRVVSEPPLLWATGQCQHCCGGDHGVHVAAGCGWCGSLLVPALLSRRGPCHGSSLRGTSASHCGPHCLWRAFPLGTQRLLLKVVCTTLCTSLLTAEVLAPELGECSWEYIKPLQPVNGQKEADRLQHTYGGAVPSLVEPANLSALAGTWLSHRLGTCVAGFSFFLPRRQNSSPFCTVNWEASHDRGHILWE